MPKTPPFSATVTLDNPTSGFGDTVVAHVKTDASPSTVTLKCYQGDTLVAASGFITSWSKEYDREFILGPTPAWQSGAARCVLQPKYFDKRGKIFDMGEVTEFEVAP